MIKDSPVPGVLFLETEKGHATSGTHEIDAHLISSWSKVYDGNCANQLGTATDFLAQYRQYLFIPSQPARVPKFTKEMIQEDCCHSSATSSGWDQWEHADWKMLSDTACQRLANLYNSIEAGSEWPEPAHWGKAHLPSKDHIPSLDPMGTGSYSYCSDSTADGFP